MTMSEEFEAWAETHALSEEARGYGMVQGAWQDAWAAATERAAKVCEALPSSYYEDDPMICAAAIRGTT